MQIPQQQVSKFLRAPIKLRKFALNQGGVLLNHQLRSWGVSSRVKMRRIANGVWQSRLGAIVFPECVTNVDLRDAWALALRIGDCAIITGPTAARLQGIPIDNPLILAISPLDLHARVPGARILRRPPLLPTSIRGSICLVNSQEAILDTLEALPSREAKQLLDIALQRRWITAKFIEFARNNRAALGQHRGKLSRLHTLASGGAQSIAERRMRSLLSKNKLYGWKGNHRIDNENGRAIASIDLANVDLQIAIEVDGRSFHSDRRSFERDRVRQNQIALAGWTILRFTWEQITQDPALVVQTVRSTIRMLQGNTLALTKV